MSLGPGEEDLEVRNDDTNENALERLSMDKVLGDPLRLNENVLELLRGNVLTEGGLEDVLGAEGEVKIKSGTSQLKSSESIQKKRTDQRF